MKGDGDIRVQAVGLIGFMPPGMVTSSNKDRVKIYWNQEIHLFSRISLSQI